MKELARVVFDPARCKKEIEQLKELLSSRRTLVERKELQLFFRDREQLTAFLGTYVPDIGPANRLAYEFPLFGDFAADILLGNAEAGEYCLTFDALQQHLERRIDYFYPETAKLRK